LRKCCSFVAAIFLISAQNVSGYIFVFAGLALLIQQQWAVASWGVIVLVLAAVCCERISATR